MKQRRIYAGQSSSEAERYGFTNEVLDYIINYDIKYRMGRDLQEEEE